MKLNFLQIVLVCFLTPAFCKASPQSNLQQKNDTDTSIVQNDTIADPKIEEVIKSTAPPKKDEVAYVSQVTKYGFKNLFKNYTYNPTMPYAAQVNPYAENYMQDYLKAHGKYLQHLKATSTSYFNFIDGILSQYGLPKEFLYLAVIESVLN